jgi:carboxypeptidase C (cathepsin A)
MGQPVAHRALLLLLRLIIATAQRPDDEVKQFPGYLGVMPSKVFSGYLKAHAEGQTFYSHYVLTESQRNPSADPLVLWQQGGPGSSGFGYG